MAGLAYQVIQRVEAESGAESPVKTPKAEPKARAGGSSSSSSSTGSGGAMDTVAQELYRTVLFMVFYAEASEL